MCAIQYWDGILLYNSKWRHTRPHTNKLKINPIFEQATDEFRGLFQLRSARINVELHRTNIVSMLQQGSHLCFNGTHPWFHGAHPCLVLGSDSILHYNKVAYLSLPCIKIVLFVLPSEQKVRDNINVIISWLFFVASLFISQMKSSRQYKTLRPPLIRKTFSGVLWKGLTLMRTTKPTKWYFISSTMTISARWSCVSLIGELGISRLMIWRFQRHSFDCPFTFQ